MTGRRPPPGTTNELEGQQMTWIAAAQQERREQIGRFLLGTGGIGGIAGATGLGLGLSDSEGLALIDRPGKEGFKIPRTPATSTPRPRQPPRATRNPAHPRPPTS